MNSFKQTVTCANCDNEFEVEFIADDSEEVNRMLPESCPKCFCQAFRTRLMTNVKDWIGFFGSNG